MTRVAILGLALLPSASAGTASADPCVGLQKKACKDAHKQNRRAGIHRPQCEYDSQYDSCKSKPLDYRMTVVDGEGSGEKRRMLISNNVEKLQCSELYDEKECAHAVSIGHPGNCVWEMKTNLCLSLVHDFKRMEAQDSAVCESEWLNWNQRSSTLNAMGGITLIGNLQDPMLECPITPRPMWLCGGDWAEVMVNPDYDYDDLWTLPEREFVLGGIEGKPRPNDGGFLIRKLIGSRGDCSKVDQTMMGDYPLVPGPGPEPGSLLCDFNYGDKMNSYYSGPYVARFFCSKFYFAVDDTNTDCKNGMQGDFQCNQECNTLEYNYDDGDCVREAAIAADYDYDDYYDYGDYDFKTVRRQTPTNAINANVARVNVGVVNGFCEGMDECYEESDLPPRWQGKLTTAESCWDLCRENFGDGMDRPVVASDWNGETCCCQDSCDTKGACDEQFTIVALESLVSQAAGGC